MCGLVTQPEIFYGRGMSLPQKTEILRKIRAMRKKFSMLPFYWSVEILHTITFFFFWGGGSKLGFSTIWVGKAVHNLYPVD